MTPNILLFRRSLQSAISLVLGLGTLRWLHKLFAPSIKRLKSLAPATKRLEAVRHAGVRSRFADATKAAPPVYCCAAAAQYNATLNWALNWLLKDDVDVVLEVGCQLNETTRMMAATAQSVIGIDIDRKATNTADKKSLGFYRQSATSDLPNVRMHILDVWDLTALTEATGDVSACVLAIDANVVLGNDLPFEVLALVRTLTRLYSPRALVVKSRALSHLQNQLTAAPSKPLTNGSKRSSRGQQKVTVQIIAANLVHDYRQAALQQLERLAPADGSPLCALEIGCHVGETTALLHDAINKRGGGGYCVGVDNGKSIIERAKQRHPHVPFAVADGWDASSLISSLERCVPGARPVLLLIDIGGLSGASGTLDALALIRQLCALFHGSLKAVIIKSSCMRSLARQLREGAWREDSGEWRCLPRTLAK